MKFPNLLALFRRSKIAEAVEAQADEKVGFFSRPRAELEDNADNRWPVTTNSFARTIDDFPIADSFGTMDEEFNAKRKVVNDGFGTGLGGYDTVMSTSLMNWYASQSFIGFQACTIIAQHWLVIKACSMAPEDALRNGWDIDLADLDKDLAEENIEKIDEIDKRMNVSRVLFEAGKFCNVFGIRILIPIIESADKEYYTKPFNIDGVTKGSFRGWNQIDPMWIYPVLDSTSAADPNSPHFYEPTFWQAGGVQYHRSHLVIIRTDEVPDILKPTYQFAGLSLPQKIYERVYAAERTANEAPLLAMSKRSTVLKVDLAKAGMKKQSFLQRIGEWVQYLDNFNIKVIGKDEDVYENDTALTDLDTVIMTQYQLVAAIAEVPATKLMGTSPKGFGATGDSEINNYHEHLESWQSGMFSPILDRHYLLLAKSFLDGGVDIKHAWNPVDSATAAEEANIQKVKADTGALLIDKGVISPDEERTRIKLDEASGYTLESDEAPGIPEPEQPGVTDESVESEEDENAAVVMAASLVTAVVTAVVEEEEALTAHSADKANTPNETVVRDLVAKLAGAIRKSSASRCVVGSIKPSATGVAGTVGDKSVSEKQHRAMEAAAHGKSTLGIPVSVGKEFVAKDSAAKEPEVPAKFRK